MNKTSFCIALGLLASIGYGATLTNEKYVTNTVDAAESRAMVAIQTAKTDVTTQILSKVIGDLGVTNEAALAASKLYTDAKITNLRSDINSEGSVATIFNEADGGGAKFVNKNGMTSFVGVNDSVKSTTGIAGQLYVIDGVNKTKLNMYNGKFCYIKGDNPADESVKDKRELIVKEDLDATSYVFADLITTLDGRITTLDGTVVSNKTDADAKFVALEGKVDANKTAGDNALSTKAAELTIKIETDVAAAKSEASSALSAAKTELTSAINAAEAKAIADATKAANDYTDGKVSGVYHFKGTCVYAELPTDGQQNADVWYVTDKEESYAWIESKNEWVALGKNFDLSQYKTWSETETVINTKTAAVQSSVEELSGIVDVNDQYVRTNIQTIKSDISTLENNVNAIDAGYKDADTSLKSDLEQKINVVDGKVTSAETEIASLETKLDGAIAAGDAAREALKSELNANIASAIATAEGYTDSKLTEQLDPVKGRVDDLEVAVAKVPGDIQDAKTAAEATAKSYTDAAVATVTADVESVKASVATLKTDVDAVPDKIDAAKSAAVAESKAYTDGKAAAISSQVSELSNEVNDLKSTVSSIPDQIAGAKTAAIATAKSYTDQEISNLSTEIGSSITEINGRLTSIETDVGNAKTDINSLKTKVNVSGTVTEAIDDAISAAGTNSKKYTDDSIADLKTNTVDKISDVADAAYTKAVGAMAKLDGIDTTVTGAIAVAKAETIEAAGAEMDSKITAKVGNILGTVKQYVDGAKAQCEEYTDGTVSIAKTNVLQIASDDATSKASIAKSEAISEATSSANGYTDAEILKLTKTDGIIDARIDDLRTNEVKTAQTAAQNAQSSADSAAAQASLATSLAGTAQDTANEANGNAAAASAAAATADGKAEAAKTAADAAQATANDAVTKANAAKTSADDAAAAAAAADGKAATAKSAADAAQASADAAQATADTNSAKLTGLDNVKQYVDDQISTNATIVKYEAVHMAGYVFDQSSPTDKTDTGITYKTWQLKTKKQMSISTSEQYIGFTLPSKSEVSELQRAVSVYLDYSGEVAPTIAIFKEEGQSVIEGESGNYKLSEIGTGRWLIYMLEISPNVFWVQIEKFINN